MQYADKEWQKQAISLLLLLFFKAHQHKATGRKTRLDIQNYGCNGNLLCYHGALLLLFINNVQQGSHRPLTPCVATRGVGGVTLNTHISLRLYMRGHYVQAWYHKYSTGPLQPSRPWLQEALPATGIHMHQAQGCIRVSLAASAWRRRRAAG